MPAGIIDFRCPSCDRRFHVTSERAGRSGTCPTCGAPFTVPAANAGAGGIPTGPFLPGKIDHVPLRVPYYADRIVKRQRRLERYLTPEEARAFVLRLYHQHVGSLAVIILIALIAFVALTIPQDGFTGAALQLLGQLAWGAPTAALLYVLGRYLLVPPKP